MGPLFKGQSEVSGQVPMPTDRVDDANTSNSVTEAVTWLYVTSSAWASATAQAAATIVTGKTTYSGILNSVKTALGSYNDTSLSLAAATRFDTKVSVPEDVFSKMVFMSPTDQKATISTYLTTNGYYAIDHRRGQIWGKAKDTVANDTMTYSYSTPISGGSAGNTVDLIKYAGTAVSATNPIYVKEVSAGTDVVVLNATGAAALNSTTAVAAEFKLLKVTCHFSSAPTTSENFVIKLDSVAGAAYDTVLSTTNPSLSAATDLVFIPDGELKFKTGDEIVTTFTNTDTRTYGLSVYYQLI